jgi:hypothetical protein
MQKAAKKLSRPDLELTPDKITYIAKNAVSVSMRTETGETVAFILRTGALLALVNLAVGMINSNSSQVFRDLDVW